MVQTVVKQVQQGHFKSVSMCVVPLKEAVCLLTALEGCVFMDVAVRNYMQKHKGLYDTNIPEKSAVQSSLLEERFQHVLERG